jgi:hypothetical protein
MALAFNDDPYGFGDTRRRPTVEGADSGVTTAPMAVPRGTAPAPTAPRPPSSPYEEGGITGGGTPAPTPTRTSNYGWLSGYDTNKLNDPTHTSAKYQIGRTFGYYNPQQGITSDLLKELNALGLANFGGSGQHLSLSGITDKGRQAGLDPYDFSGDFIQSWAGGTNPNAKWQYDAWSNPSAGGSSIDNLLSSFMPTAQPQQQGNGFISPEQLASLLQTLQPPPAPSAPPMTFTLPEREQTQSPVSRDFTPSLVSGMGSPEVGKALQVMAMKYPGVLTGQPAHDPNSLVAEIMRLIGGGGGYA